MAKPNQDPKKKEERLAKKCFNLNSIELREYAALLCFPFWFEQNHFLKANEQFKLLSAHLSLGWAFLGHHIIPLLTEWRTRLCCGFCFSFCFIFCFSASFIASQKPINAQLSSTFNLLQFLFASFIVFSWYTYTLKKLLDSAIEDLRYRLISKGYFCRICIFIYSNL